MVNVGILSDPENTWCLHRKPQHKMWNHVWETYAAKMNTSISWVFIWLAGSYKVCRLFKKLKPDETTFFFNGWWLKNQLLENTPLLNCSSANTSMEHTVHYTHIWNAKFTELFRISMVNLLIHVANSMEINLTFMKFIIMWMWKYSKYQAPRAITEEKDVHLTHTHTHVSFCLSHFPIILDAAYEKKRRES